MTSPTLQERYTAYQTAFADISDDECERLLRQSVTDDVVFTSPTEKGKGSTNLVEHVGRFQKQFPGAFFTINSLLTQHDQILAEWTMHLKDGPATTGHTYARSDEHGRITHFAGFFRGPEES